MAAHIPDRPVKLLGALCVVLFVLDFFVDRHPHVPGEGFPAFYAIVGFGAFALIVLGAKQLRTVIRRDETYYGDQAVDAEDYPDAGLDQKEVSR